jgi:hypothetical protein
MGGVFLPEKGLDFVRKSLDFSSFFGLREGECLVDDSGDSEALRGVI